MTVTWTLELDCTSCKAHVVYDTEIPIIKHDRNNIILNNRAHKFVIEHPDFVQGLELPPNVGSVRHSYYRMVELPTRYTPCPVCGERIYFDA